MRFLCVSVLLCAGLAVSTPLRAQNAPRPTFEAVTVRSNKNPLGAGTTGLSTQPGRFVATNVPMQIILLMALQDRTVQPARSVQLDGLPEWVRQERFDIVATTGGQKSSEETMAMLRTLLEDRFKLKTHRETRATPIYHLVLARRDGKLGRDIKPSTLDCEAVQKERSARLSAILEEAQKKGQPPPALSAQQVLGAPGEPCSPLTSIAGPLSGTSIKLDGLSMAALASRLRTFAGREVVDKTGLAGRYDVTLRFQFDLSTLARQSGVTLTLPPSLPTTAPVGGDEAPPLAAALQEQLGLKLEPHEGTGDFLVVDQIERPVDD